MCDEGLTGWKLILAGGVEIGVGDYIERLRKLAEGYPIEIIESPDYKTLKDLYGKAKIFWSASGFEIDETKNPEKVEHFGITVVEAMAGGAVPVVYDAGGHKEIVEDDKNGYLWESTGELIRKTQKLVAGSANSISKIAVESAMKYSYQNFEANVKKLL
jgi:glycosyltransferase involved in cell wall biosynthesis